MTPIRLTKELVDKLEDLTYYIETEVAGFLVGDIEKGVMTLSDLIIPDQIVSGGDVEFKEDEILKVRTSLTDEEWKRVQGHWHSHIDMGCFWSVTDNTLIKQFSKGRKKSVFIVSSNKKDKRDEFNMLCRVVLNEPIQLDINGVPLEVISEEGETVEQEPVFVTETRKKLSKAVAPVVKTYRANGTNGWWRKNKNLQYDDFGDDYGYEGYLPGNSGRSTYQDDFAVIEQQDRIVWAYNITSQMKEAICVRIPKLSSYKWEQESNGYYYLELDCQTKDMALKAKKIISEVVDECEIELREGVVDTELQDLKTEMEDLGKVSTLPEIGDEKNAS